MTTNTNKGIAESDRNREVMIDFLDLFMTQGRVREAFEKHVDSGYIQHSPDYRDGREGTIQDLEEFFGSMAPGFPKIDIRHLVIAGDLAVVHLHGRAGDDDLGIVGTDIFRLVDGKIVEHWDVVQPVRESSRNHHAMY